MRIKCADSGGRSVWVVGWTALPLRYDRHTGSPVEAQPWHALLEPGGGVVLTTAGWSLFRADTPPTELFVLVAGGVDPETWEACRYRMASGWLGNHGEN